ncbi:MAG: hypothetical protein ACTHLL_04245 [Candidatus Nitrosocosmicus sp.]
MDRIDSNINWDDVLKKEARGLDDADFGEVHDVGSDFVLTQKGVVHKDKYQLPKNLVSRFDGHKLWFNITKDESDKYKNTESIENISSVDSNSNNPIDETTSNTDQSAGYTTRGYLNREDRYESRRTTPEDISDITDKSISHRGTYRDMVNDPDLPRNTITTDDNYNNRDIDDSAPKDTLYDGRNINDMNAKDISESTLTDNTLEIPTTTTSNNISTAKFNIDWQEVIEKEARGLDDADFGEVQEVGSDFVLTQKGVVHKDKYQLPKNLAIRFDGHKLWFNITKDESDKYKKD